MIESLLASLLVKFLGKQLQRAEILRLPKGAEKRVTKALTLRLFGRRADVDLVLRMADEP